jgi:hypothetical protein
VDEVDPLAVLAADPHGLTGLTPGTTWRLVTTWWASDPTVAKSLAWVNSLPQSEPLRHEAEAGIHMLQARWAWAEADRLRRAERYRRTPRVAGPDDGRRQVTMGTCPSCGALVRLRLDGGLRAHDRGSGAARTPSQDALPAADKTRCEGSGRSPVA